MNAWDISASLVRFIILGAASVLAIVLWRWVGGRGHTYATVVTGLLFLAVAEGIHLFQLSLGGGLSAAQIAWDSVYINALGYLVICLGIVFWAHDFRRVKRALEQDNRTLKESASIDFLTQLLNRRSAELHLRREIARARRNRAPLGFIMIDLDCFKRVNDGHGHQAGDAVLVHVGRILRSRARESDVVVRYGGDEFLVVTPDTDLAGTAKLAEALRTLIQEKPANYDGRELPVQASLGVAGAGPGQQVTAEELLARADKALYAAKERGRNQVVTWEDSAGSLPEAVPAARSAAVAQ